MGRPTAKDGIRARVRADGVQEIHFEELPGRWIASPERDRAAAIAWAKRNRDRLVVAKTPRIRDLADGFFAPDSAWVKRQRDHGRTFIGQWLAIRQGMVKNHVVRLFGDALPRELTRRQIDNALMTATSVEGDKLPLSGATKNKIAYTLKTMYEEWIDLGLCESNPLHGLRPFSKEPAAPRGAFSLDELAQMFPAGHAPLIRVWWSSLWASCFLVLAETGLRPGELRALRWRDWWTEERFFPIRRAIESGTEAKEKTTKTGAVKAAFVSERTKQELELWRIESYHNGPDDWIFTDSGAAPITNAGMNQAFKAGLKRLKLDATRTPYWLRHSFNTYALEALSEAEVQRLMGHSSAAMTRIYRHPDDESLLRAGLPARDALDRARGE